LLSGCTSVVEHKASFSLETNETINETAGVLEATVRAQLMVNAMTEISRQTLGFIFNSTQLVPEKRL